MLRGVMVHRKITISELDTRSTGAETLIALNNSG